MFYFVFSQYSYIHGMAHLKCFTFLFFIWEQVVISWNNITFYKSAILLIIVVAATVHQQLSFMMQQASLHRGKKSILSFAENSIDSHRSVSHGAIVFLSCLCFNKKQI